MAADDGTARSSAFLRFGFGFFFLALFFALGLGWFFARMTTFFEDGESDDSEDGRQEQDDLMEELLEDSFDLGMAAGVASPTAEEVECFSEAGDDLAVIPAVVLMRDEKKGMVLFEEGHDHHGVEKARPRLTTDPDRDEFYGPEDFDTYSWEDIDIIWDHTIGLLSFHQEAEPGFGLNIWLEAPVDGPCVLGIVDASYATHKTYTGEDVHTYVLDASAGECGSPRVQSLQVTNQAFVGYIRCLSMIEVDVFGKVGATIKIEGGFRAVCRTCGD